jgi:hypothetical protein|eukprot:COSAG06_NODE_1112_length_10647_cov_8.424820_3_plen_35_part_00
MLIEAEDGTITGSGAVFENGRFFFFSTFPYVYMK